GFGATGNSRVAHRFWELAISLDDISAEPGQTVWMGVRIVSPSPMIDDYTPDAFEGGFEGLFAFALGRPTARLLILADGAFVDELAELKEHKDYTGMPSYVQSWQDLDVAFHSQGRDAAERVKRAIAQYEQYCGTLYVMLVGDTDRFPVRYTMNDRGTEAAFNRAFYATDLYYADLYKAGGSFDTWDANNNGYYGELQGETIAGTLNLDQADLDPDVFVGRVPASTEAEVETYVDKVIGYEFGAYSAAWHKRALVMATTDWVNDACQTKETIIGDSLGGYTVTRLYQAGNPCQSTSAPTSANINNTLNNGVGLVNYVGHGHPSGLAIPGDWYQEVDMSGLSNEDMLPIMFAVACDTAQFATQPPYAPYTDLNGVHHIGTAAGETFGDVPPQPAPIQTTDNPESLGEAVTVKHETGAVAFIGCATGSQPFARDLDRFFFQGLSSSTFTTLGSMWAGAIRRYYQSYTPPTTVNPP
ncbi:MAG: hypothetical protein H5T69_19380, partial [Chloroflexi bacterium]|nr:hypothetical protein [Chloroflexota bacterium]